MRVRVFLGLLCGGMVCSPYVAAVTDRDDVPVEPAAYDLVSAAAYCMDSTQIVFEIGTRGELDPQTIRILLFDAPPSKNLSRDEATWMVDRGLLYCRAAEALGWAWDEVSPALSVHGGSKMFVLLSAFSGRQPRSYVVETYRPGRAIVDRVPNHGAEELSAERLPGWGLPATYAVSDLGPIFKDAPVSLSMRFETELKASAWQRSSEIPPPVWVISNGLSLPIRLAVREVGAADWSEVSFTGCWATASAMRWEGIVSGMPCILRVHHNEGKVLQADALVLSSTERAMEFAVGVMLPQADWVWHHDYVVNVPILQNPGVVYQSVTPSSFGRAKGYSRFPFGIVSWASQAVWVANHPDEPRHFRVVAEHRGASIFLGLIYDLALTLATSNFPGRGTVACRFEWLDLGSSLPFAVAAQRWQELWDVRSERGNRRISVAEMAAAATVAGHYEICPSFPALIQNYQDWLSLCSALPYSAGEGATATLSGGVRDEHGRFTPNRDVFAPSPCLRFDWCLDPDLPALPAYPSTPAMTVWRDMEREIRNPSIKGMVVSLPNPSLANYDLRAIGVADFPCVYEGAIGRAALMNGNGAYEFFRQVAGHAQRLGKWIAVRTESSLDPQYLRYADAVCLIAEQSIVDRTLLRAVRVLAGKRPVFAVPAVFGSQREQRALWAEYGFWGFLPIGIQDHALEPYLPFIERIAQADWDAARSGVTSGAVETHTFGRPGKAQHFVMHNTGRKRIETSVPVPAKAWLWNPLTGEVHVGPGVATPTLLGDETQIWSLVPMNEFDEEYEFVRSSSTPRAARWLENLDSLRREKELGVNVCVVRPHPSSRHGRNRIVLRARNNGQRPITLTGLRIIGKVFWDVAEEATIDPGDEASVESFFEGQSVGTDGGIEVQWRLEQEGKDMVTGVRHLALDMADSISVWTKTSELVPVAPGELVARFVLENNADERARVSVRWSGDFSGGRKIIELQPREQQEVELLVRSREPQSGELYVTIVQGDHFSRVLKYERVSTNE